MPRRVLEGRIVGDAMDKTVTVLVERRTMHPIYKKYVKQSSKYAAHDETNLFRVGDLVEIEECRPISKRKTWTVTTDPKSLARELTEKVKAVAVEATPVKAKKAGAKKTASKK
ncbi:MAG: 30S ribosomal protein S17 [Alphaproteobacteria bacterium]|jgi:small subunit ribosomal protein S17|nr:30S ribosomal protein S17 [Alphaproteobacteria bacterium]MCB1550731.1 30S ribosomal protein S17 [Alphaproteobacteria bacterium]MCB9985652.1 30S ribosomal protein S17 [Micavibrio sp.]HPQ51489.1 30S ribosomal protein S17 [Alphaproteobacteria bacterium]HRK98309.1 30S ribosomal protein S17 [Alphaproteobacteria bacterium]